MEKVFINLFQNKELNEISVSEICKLAGLNRTTFYANYPDIYGLADSIRDKLENSLSELYQNEITQGFNSHDYLKLFIISETIKFSLKHILNLDMIIITRLSNTMSILRRSIFKINISNIIWRFFKSGITQIIKLWLQNGCKESPEDIFVS